MTTSDLILTISSIVFTKSGIVEGLELANNLDTEEERDTDDSFEEELCVGRSRVLSQTTFCICIS